MATLATALAPLAAYAQFIVCKLVPVPGKPGKMDKIPCSARTGAVGVDAHDPANWVDLQTAQAAVTHWGAGYCLAFTLTPNDPFWCLDVDGALGPQGWSPLAQALCTTLAGCAVEVSQSGRGLHIWGAGRPPEHSCKNVQLGIEFYSEGRFIALGQPETALGWAAYTPAALPDVVAQYFPPRASSVGEDWGDGPAPEWRGPTDDAELIRRAMQSKSARSAFGNGATFADLWECREDVLARAYPSDTDTFDRSSADAALAQHLAFWTGRDCSRIERLMRQSALVREKWDRADYLRERTIANAVRMQRDVLQDKAPEPMCVVEAPVDTVVTPEARHVTGSTFLPPAAQVDLFKGCVYVTGENRVYVPGCADLLKEAQFKVRFGGYSFGMDLSNERTTRNAWEAFTESQALRHPAAATTCFRPDLPPGVIINDAVNVYTPPVVARKLGDPAPFLAHMAKLFPVERDRNIVLYYMAAMVQHQGVKFQWAPIVQGCQGNGKTLLSRAVEAAIGEAHCYWPRASRLAAQFNAWMAGKTAALVEDIHIKRHNQLVDIVEELKPMITNTRIEVERKGVDQGTVEVCCNFFFNSNHKDGIPYSQGDRRYAPFFTPQQTEDDLVRDGMNGAYFQNLYNWFWGGGSAIVAELLWTLPIPDEFNPATGCQRAPATSSRAEALSQSLGYVEQEVMEAIEQGLQGFRGGWVSSIMLDQLLERSGRNVIPRTKRRALMQRLGYDWHPALRDGRVDNPVLPDGGKPRLYVRPGSPQAAITVAGEVAKAYSKAQ